VRRALIVLALLGVWSVFPPYLGPPLGLELDVAAKVEIVDHVVPGVVVALCAGLAALLMRRGVGAQLDAIGLALTSLCFLAGLWQAATHAPLVLDGGGSETPWGAVLFHASPGPVILAIALALTLTAPAADGAQAPRSG
jgi:hypothetical protein